MTAEELLAQYTAGKRDLHGAYLRGADLGGAYLVGADLSYAYLRGAYLGGADLGGVDFSGADLRGADLRGAGLRGAYLGGVDLRGAYLSYAYLRGVYLRGADLRGADFSGAELGDQWVIQGPVRSDGYQFLLMRLTCETTPMVRAGCRWLSLADAKAHWEKTRGGTQLGNESLDILVWLERAMHLRGLK